MTLQKNWYITRQIYFYYYAALSLKKYKERAEKDLVKMVPLYDRLIAALAKGKVNEARRCYSQTLKSLRAIEAYHILCIKIKKIENRFFEGFTDYEIKDFPKKDTYLKNKKAYLTLNHSKKIEQYNDIIADLKQIYEDEFKDIELLDYRIYNSYLDADLKKLHWLYKPVYKETYIPEFTPSHYRGFFGGSFDIHMLDEISLTFTVNPKARFRKPKITKKFIMDHMYEAMVKKRPHITESIIALTKEERLETWTIENKKYRTNPFYFFSSELDFTQDTKTVPLLDKIIDAKTFKSFDHSSIDYIIIVDGFADGLNLQTFEEKPLAYSDNLDESEALIVTFNELKYLQPTSEIGQTKGSFYLKICLQNGTASSWQKVNFIF